MNEKEKILTDMKMGEAIKELVELPSFKYIDDIFIKLYQDNLTILLEREDVKARAICNALDEIHSQIKRSVDIAKMAREKYEQKFRGGK